MHYDKYRAAGGEQSVELLLERAAAPGATIAIIIMIAVVAASGMINTPSTDLQCSNFPIMQGPLPADGNWVSVYRGATNGCGDLGGMYPFEEGLGHALGLKDR